MERYIGIPLLTLAAILNATVMVELRIGGGAPDLVFLLVVSWALLSNIEEALLWAVIGGVLQDLLSRAPLGTSALGLVMVVFVADSLLGELYRDNVIIPPVVAALGTVIYHLGILLVLWLVNIKVPLRVGLMYVTVPTLVFNVVLIVPIFRIAGSIRTWLTPRRVV